MPGSPAQGLRGLRRGVPGRALACRCAARAARPDPRLARRPRCCLRRHPRRRRRPAGPGVPPCRNVSRASSPVSRAEAHHENAEAGAAGILPDREDAVLRFTADTRVWPTNNKAVMRSVVRVHAAGVSRRRLAQYMGCLTGGAPRVRRPERPSQGKKQHRREVGDTWGSRITAGWR